MSLKKLFFQVLPVVAVFPAVFIAVAFTAYADDRGSARSGGSDPAGFSAPDFDKMISAYEKLENDNVTLTEAVDNMSGKADDVLTRNDELRGKLEVLIMERDDFKAKIEALTEQVEIYKKEAKKSEEYKKEAESCKEEIVDLRDKVSVLKAQLDEKTMKARLTKEKK
jgi:peptidoglycan hydrolase CwlO-like protein